MLLSLDTSRCIRCAGCVAECPANIFKREESGEVIIKEKSVAHCIKCGHCVAICPKAAIALDDVDSQRLFPVTAAPLDAIQRSMLFRARRSIRLFKDEPVSHELVLAALEDACYAPTAMNTQNIEWLVVEGADKIYVIGQAIAQGMIELGGSYASLAARHSRDADPILRKAPMLIIAHGVSDSVWSTYDATIATTTLELALHDRGVGATWAGFFMAAAQRCAAKNAALPHVSLPAGRSIQTALMVGLPSKQYARVPSRKPVRVQFI